MGVTARERPKGSGVWRVFVDHQNIRMAKKCGSRVVKSSVAQASQPVNSRGYNPRLAAGESSLQTESDL